MVALAVAITLVAAILFVYSAFIRPWHMEWGASHLDKVARVPGDELSPHAPGSITRAIVIDASPDKVWPVLEKALRELAARTGMVVAVEVPMQGMALVSPADWPRVQAQDEALDAVREYFLKPQSGGGKTRLLARLRSPLYSGMGTRAADFFFRELAHFLADRRMLLAIKEAAEKAT